MLISRRNGEGDEQSRMWGRVICSRRIAQYMAFFFVGVEDALCVRAFAFWPTEFTTYDRKRSEENLRLLETACGRVHSRAYLQQLYEGNRYVGWSQNEELLPCLLW